MALPVPPNPNNPIPNNPFYYPPTNRLEGGDQGVLQIGAGLSVTPEGVLNATGLGPVAAVTYLTAGAGVAVNNNTGNVLITNTGVVTLNAGTGISISGSNGNFTITNTLPASPSVGTVTQVATGIGLTGGPITGSGTIALANTGVGPGTYTNPTLIVDAQGRITFATNGTPSSVSGTYPIQIAGGSLISIAGASVGSPGAVQLEDSFSSTSITKAATPNAVKAAYDRASTAISAAAAAGSTASLAQATANAALPKAGGTMTGLITFAPGQTFPGTAGVTQILAGTNITISPVSGTGAVTINASGGTSPVPATPTMEGIVFGCTVGWTTALGENALLGNTGHCNTAIGCDALPNANSGDENTAVGHYALCRNQTGSSNTGVGQKALFVNDSGSNNVAMGVNALFSNSTGSWNTGVGLNALYYSDTGCYNTSVGWQSGIGSDTGCYNTSVGTCTLANISSCSGNTAFGSDSLMGVNGNYNTAIGYCSGDLQTSGDCNVFIGCGVKAVDPTGSCQLSIGFSATDYWLTGTSSKAIKPGAGIIDKNGSCGTAGQVLSSDGSNAIEWVTGGGGGATPATPTVEGIVFGCTDSVSFNYGLGDSIFSSLTTGTLNIAIGAGALATADTATSNTAIGIGTLYNSTSGIQNVALGQQALFSVTTEGLNTAIGSQALQNTTGGNNTALGNYAGNLLTTGCYNIIIGDQAGGVGPGALDTGNCNIIIGNRISVANSSGNNQLAIGMETLYWLTGDSTGAIKPGAGIADCAGSCGTAGQVLTSTGSNAVAWASPGVPTWVDAGTITIGATTTAPTKGNVGWDKIYYRRLGGKEYEVIYRFNQSAPGSAGSGDYLFTLPAGLQFDTTLAFQSAVSFNTGGLFYLGSVIPGQIGHVIDGSNGSMIAQPLVYNATQFRIIVSQQSIGAGPVLNTNYAPFGSSVYPLGFSSAFTFRFQFTST